MLDIKMIRQNVAMVKEKLATRNVDEAKINEFVALDEKRRAELVKVEELKNLEMMYLVKLLS